MPGEESVWLVRSLLEMGAHTVLASNWAVDDVSTALWMREFYSKYLNGAAVHEAARHAVGTVRSTYPSAYHWAAFSVFGAF
jgi:CHAT domain-containing protein